MPAPRKGVYAPAHDRKFYLPEATIQRLGGSQAAEIMRRLVEEKQPESQIIAELGMSAADFQAITLTYPFKRELKAQLKLREHDKKFIEKGKIRDVPPGTPALPPQTVPADVLDVKLPKGVSPQEWALKRINQVTPQAIQRLVWLMQNARQESVQYNAAVKILGLNGIVEVEKSISVIADAEAIIRELNRRGPYRRKNDAEGAEGPVEPAAEDAEIIEIEGSVDGPGESGPAPSTP